MEMTQPRCHACLWRILQRSLVPTCISSPTSKLFQEGPRYCGPETNHFCCFLSQFLPYRLCENNKIIDLSHSAFGYIFNAVIVTRIISDWVFVSLFVCFYCCCFFVVTGFQTINRLRHFGSLPLGHYEQRTPVEFAEAEVLILPSHGYNYWQVKWRWEEILYKIKGTF